jgi:alcohol dehydrogenase
MRAVAFFQHGGADVVQTVEDWPEPVPAENGVVVQVEACSLNRMDILVRRGLPDVPTPLPRVPGADIAGIVIECGASVDEGMLGRRVLVDPMITLPNGKAGALGENADGGLVERIAVPEANIIALPDSVTFEQAAALPIAYGTAYRLLVTRGGVSHGDTVVVLGASGGLGTGAVQIAAMRGAEVIAVASSDEKLRRLAQLGAAHLVQARGADYGSKVWKLTAKKGADVIVDTIGAETWPTTLRTVACGGRILVCGATTGFDVRTDLRYVWVREATIIGSDGCRREDLEELLALVAQRKLVPVIDRVVGFSEVSAAEKAMEDRSIFGKIVVSPRK